MKKRISSVLRQIFVFLVIAVIFLFVLFIRSCERKVILKPTEAEKPRLIPVISYEPKLIPFLREKPPIDLSLLPVIPGEVRASLHFKDEAGNEAVIVETKRGEYYQVSPNMPREIKIYQWKRPALEFPVFNGKLVFSENYDFGTSVYFCLGIDFIRFRSWRFGADVGISFLREALISPCLRYEVGEINFFNCGIFYMTIDFGYNFISRRPVIGFSLTW